MLHLHTYAAKAQSCAELGGCVWLRGMQSLRKLSKQSVASAQLTTRRGVCHGIIGKHLRDFWPKWKWMKLQGVVFLSRASSASCFVWKVFLHMHVHMSHHSLSFYQKHQDRVLRQWGVMVWGKRGGEKKGGGGGHHFTTLSLPPLPLTHMHTHKQTGTRFAWSQQTFGTFKYLFGVVASGFLRAS